MTIRRFFAPPRALALPALCVLASACSAAEETNPWSDETYVLDIDAADWAEPRGIGKGIDDFVPTFLLRVHGDDPNAFDVTLGTQKDGAQDPCNMTSVAGATARPPRSTIGPSRVSLFIQNASDGAGVQGTIYDLTIKNVLPDGDEPANSGELTATLDFRELYPLVTTLIMPTPASVCASFEDTYFAPCMPCPNDGDPFCLTVRATYLGAVPTDTPIEPIDSVDPSCRSTAE
jgi:hypothetical protein